jgi:hypothetical protein
MKVTWDPMHVIFPSIRLFWPSFMKNVVELTVAALGLLLNVTVMIEILETSAAPFAGLLLTTLIHPERPRTKRINPVKRIFVALALEVINTSS